MDDHTTELLARIRALPQPTHSPNDGLEFPALWMGSDHGTANGENPYTIIMSQVVGQSMTPESRAILSQLRDYMVYLSRRIATPVVFSTPDWLWYRSVEDTHRLRQGMYIPRRLF